MSAETQNAFTIDVEDYWSVFARDWLHIDTEPTDAVVKNTERFLEMLAEHKVKATFFILGEVAKKYPALIKKIAEQGNEIGVHGFYHKQVFKLSAEQFRQEISDCKNLLEDISGVKVFGHRAPAFSIMPQTRWALEILSEEGFDYDSSVYPIKGERYGWPGFSRDICEIELSNDKSIIEVPMSTISILGKTLPAAGGGYLRHFPYSVTKCAIKHINKTRPAIVYMHPYEIDTKEFDFSVEHLDNVRKKEVLKFHKIQLRNRGTVREKVLRLLSDFRFTTLGQVIEKQWY